MINIRIYKKNSDNKSTNAFTCEPKNFEWHFALLFFRRQYQLAVRKAVSARGNSNFSVSTQRTCQVSKLSQCKQKQTNKKSNSQTKMKIRKLLPCVLVGTVFRMLLRIPMTFETKSTSAF